MACQRFESGASVQIAQRTVRHHALDRLRNEGRHGYHAKLRPVVVCLRDRVGHENLGEWLGSELLTCAFQQQSVRDGDEQATMSSPGLGLISTRSISCWTN